MKKIITEKLYPTLLQLLKQGSSPKKLAICIACGMVIGIMPILGLPTPLCVVAAFIFRLNQVIIQLANYLVYPIQLLLFYPFSLLGAHFIFTGQMMNKAYVEQIFSDALTLTKIFELFGVFILQAFIGWIFVLPFLLIPIYYVCYWLLVKKTNL